MKNYIKPETLTVNLQNTTPLLTGSSPSGANNFRSSASQLSRESSFSSNEVVEE